MTSPGSFEDVVNLLVPELQKRGIYWKDYAAPGGTARENIQNAPGQPQLPESHPGRKIKLNAKRAGVTTGGAPPKTRHSPALV